MIIDARSRDGDMDAQADVVIIGSGAAGITLALELGKAGLEVILLEAGGFDFDAQEQDFYRAEAFSPIGHGPVEMFRRRMLGGTTSIWGGRCIPFDPIDFEERPWIPNSRWPIGYHDVAQYHDAAAAYLHCGKAEFVAGDALGDSVGPVIEGFADPDVILDRIERFSHPTHFGKWYQRALTEAPNIKVMTHAKVRYIATDDNGAEARGVVVGLPGGKSWSVAAKRVVVAAGGLETPRILLSSNQVRSRGLGNEHDLVGRYYQSHLEAQFGQIFFARTADEARIDYERSDEGVYCRRYIWLSPEAQRAQHLAGLVIRPSHPNIVDPAHRNGILSAMYFAKAMIVPEYARKLTAMEASLRHDMASSSWSFHAAHLRNIVLGAPALFPFALKWLRYRLLAERKLPSVFLTHRDRTNPIEINAEQAPNPDSRITLGEDEDGEGMRRIRLDWRITAGDRARLADGLRTIQASFARNGAASLDFTGSELEDMLDNVLPVGGHHIGTARMGRSAEEGVCDANCELFDTRGVYVAGAATFVTSSFANPTFTIVAMTLRLADHLRQVIQP